MSNFTIKDMLAMQQALQEKYKDKWEAISPEAGKHKLLWMLGEVGEVIDIIKKNGDQKSVEDVDLRQHLVEEMADVPTIRCFRTRQRGSSWVPGHSGCDVP